MNVSSILRRKGTHVEMANARTTFADAARCLRDRQIGSLVVLDEHGDLFGVCS